MVGMHLHVLLIDILSLNLLALRRCRTDRRRMLERATLLKLDFSSFLGLDALPVDSCLPSRCATEEHILNLFQGLSGCFWEEEESMYSHTEAEDTEDEVGLPLDVDKGWRCEVAKCKIEDPVGGGCDGDSFASDAEWEEFGWVDPAGECQHGFC